MRSIRTKGTSPTRRAATLFAVFALMSSLILPARTLQGPALAAASPLTPEQVRAAYGKVGMSFEANRGQTAGEVKFLARGSGYTLFLTPAEAVFVMARATDAPARAGGREQVPGGGAAEASPEASSGEPPAVLRMKLEGANTQPAVSGLEELAGKVNYFTGSDPDHWHADVPTYGRVHYAGVYPGVDMLYYGNQRQLEYDFVVSPGADYRQIALSFEGADKVEVEAATGDLLLEVGEGTLRQLKPLVYQEENGGRREIESRYVQKDAGRIGFEVGAYDARRPLVIDPVLAYSTYLGGGDNDFGADVVVDSSGNAYVTGTTSATNFPVANAIRPTNIGGADDAFVTKFNASGSALIYSTYLGGIGGSDDNGQGIALDSSGNVYVTGRTISTDFPVVNAIQATKSSVQDAFVTKLNASGSALVYSTYIGGNGSDDARGIAVDAAGNAYVTGYVDSTNFPLANAVQATKGGPGSDAFVTKLNASGSAFVYSTYLGGAGGDAGSGIASDSAGNAYVTGTAGLGFPTASPFQAAHGGNGDAFVTKLNASGSAFVYSTFLGGGSSDDGYGIAVDSTGNAYVTGGTQSTDFPKANAFQGAIGGVGSRDAFVTKLNAVGSALVYSTYLGGNNVDEGYGIALDSSGNTYITGRTISTNFPVAAAIQATFGGLQDAFVTKLNAAGSALSYSTYLGGVGSDHGQGIAADSAGNAYVTGSTQSTDFPTANAFQGSKSSNTDAFVAKVGSFVISGRVIDSGGAGISGVNVTLGGSNSAVATTDANGSFVFLDTTPGGSFSVTPAREGFIFNPPFFSTGNLDTNVPEIIFTGTATNATPTPMPTPTPTPTPTPAPAPTPAAFQFSAVSYGAGEGDGSVQIIVTRSGDTSSAASVDYATTDGTAIDRRDYHTAIGRLRFAAGETAKGFRVFITDDTYAEGNETLDITLSDPSPGGQVTGSGTVILTVVDNDLATATTNRIDTTLFFIRQHYVDFLNREPDSAGLAFWTNNIESCGANTGCRQAKRIDTSAAFFLSIEFQETGFLAHRLYRSAFNRLASYREFVRDAHEIGRGVVIGQPGAEAQLEANKQAFADEFVTRPEFNAIYGGLTNGQYVDALNANTGGSLSASERNALVSGLNAATETRATVLRKVADDADFKAREMSPAFVLMQYFGYLRRNPDDTPDTDFAGYDFWLSKLGAFGGDFRQAEMVKAFFDSVEYRERFGLP